MTSTPSPDDNAVQDALLCVLRARGLEPRNGWVTVRMVRWQRERLYTVITTHEPARIELYEVLPHDRDPRGNVVGIWLLNETQARGLCENSWRGEPALTY